MTKIYNKKEETAKRKNLRNNMPKAEIILWSKIKNKQVNGYKFRRQYGIDKYVVDFYCTELKLAIEIDGDIHFMENEKEEYDKVRQKKIESLGIKFLRFQNLEIYNNLNGVVSTIYQYIKEK